MNPQEILAAFLASLANQQSQAGPSQAMKDTTLESPDTIITDAEATALSRKIRAASPVAFAGILKAVIPIIKGFLP